MKSGSLVCRHYAPIISVLLNETGIPNDIVSSSGCDEAISDDKGQLVRKPEQPGLHAYVITRGGNAIVQGLRIKLHQDYWGEA